MNYMIFYREMDLRHYIYNGRGIPISIEGNDDFAQDDCWAADLALKKRRINVINDAMASEGYIDTEIQEVAFRADAVVLNDVLDSKKRGFVIRKQKYIVLQRGEFVME